MEGMVTRKVELRGIGFFSVFKIFFSIILFFSLVFLILFDLFGFQIVGTLAGWIGDIRQLFVDLQTKFPSIFDNKILFSLFQSLLLGLILGLFIGIATGIFNLFVALLGGLSIKIREKTPEKKTSYL